MATENLIPLSSFLGPEGAVQTGSAVRSGVVRASAEDGWLVSHERGSLVARVAASCLLAPEEGDLVLYARVPEGAFILGVLQRSSSQHSLRVDGELRISATSVHLDADEELTLRSRGAARILTEALTLATTEATWVGKQLRMLGEAFVVDATRITQVSTYADREAESSRERLGRSYRDVRESEHVRAGSMTFSLRDSLRLRANTAAMTAKKLFRMASEQIHLG